MKSFNEFQLDTDHQCLWRAGNRLALTRKAFAVLNCLVENAGSVVTKDQLMDSVWPGVYVGEENLKVYIRELRALLGDRAATPTYIETYRDRGYSFIAPVIEDPIAHEKWSHNLLLCGRAKELAKLHERFNKARNGFRQLVFITGEPGIGKSSIIETFLSQLTGDVPVCVGFGQCIESYHEQEAFYPVLEAFGRLLREPFGDAFADVLATQAPTWLVQFPAAAKAAGLQTLQNAIVGAGRERMLREICDGLEAFAAETPLILILEDLHWSDRSTLDFIAAVARRREPARLLVLATYRPVELILSHHPLRQLKSELCTHEQGVELPLEFLPKEATSDYLAKRFSSRLTELLLDEVYEKTNGNPLFIVELMKHLVNQELIVEKAGDWRLVGTPEQLRSIVPDSLIEIIQKQVEQFTEDEQLVLRAATVVGPSFSAAVVAAGLDYDVAQVEDCCDSLARRRLLLCRAGLEESPDGQVSGLFQFTHSLHRDALYHQCSPVARLNLHRRIGEAIEKMWSGQEQAIAAELARHFQESRDYARVVRYVRMQAENARHRYAYSQAVALLDTAIQCTRKLPQPAQDIAYLDALMQLGRIYDELGDKAKAADVYQTVAERAGAAAQPQVEIESLVCLSSELAVSDTRKALEIAARAASLCNDEISSSIRVNAETWANFLRLAWDGWDEDLAKAHRQGIEQLRLAGESDLMAQQAFALAVLQVMTSDYPGALQTTSEIIPLLARQGNALAHFTAHWMRAWALFLLGRGGESLHTLQEALSLAQKNNNAFEVAMGQLFLAELHCEAFDPSGALPLCDQALSTIRQTNSPFGLQRALIMSGIAQMEAGNSELAKAYLFESSDMYAASKIGLSWYYKMPLHCALADYWLGRRDAGAARKEVERLRDITERNVNVGWKARTREVSSRIALAEADFTRGETEIAEALQLISEHNIPLVGWRVHATAAALSTELGFPERAADHLAARNSILLSFADSFGSGDALREAVLLGIQQKLH